MSSSSTILARHLATHGADLSLERAHAGLAGVALDQRTQRLVLELDRLLLQAVRLDLLAEPESRLAMASFSFIV